MTYFTSFSSVSIVDFEQVSFSWVAVRQIGIQGQFELPYSKETILFLQNS